MDKKEYKKIVAVISKKVGAAIKNGDSAALDAALKEQLSEMKKQLKKL